MFVLFKREEGKTKQNRQFNRKMKQKTNISLNKRKYKVIHLRTNLLYTHNYNMHSM